MPAGRTHIELTPFTKARPIVELIHGGHVRRLGWARPRDIPKDGLCYLVEWLSPKTVRVHAYADTFGRIFNIDKTVLEAPAQRPVMSFEANPIYGMEQGSVCVFDKSGERHRVAGFTSSKRRFALSEEAYAFSFQQKPDLEALPFEDALAYAFFTLMPEHEDLIDAQKDELAQAMPRGTHHLIDKLTRTKTVGDILDALRHEVARVQNRESLGARNKRYPAFYERYLKRLLVEHGVLEASFPQQELELSAHLHLSHTGQWEFVMASLDFSLELRSWLIEVESIITRYELALDRLSETRLLFPEESDLNRADLSNLQPTKARDSAFAPFAPEHVGPFAGWEIRQAFADKGETLGLPYRLDADLRLSPSLRRALLYVRCPHVNHMPRSRFMPTIDTWLPTTLSERKVMLSKYATRCALLCAARLFSLAPILSSVTVQLTYLGTEGESGLATFTFPRERLYRELDHALQKPLDYIETFGTLVEFKDNILFPTDKMLSDTDPAYYNEKSLHAVERSDEEIPAPYRPALFAQRTTDLSIVEGVDRLQVALELTQEDFSGSTQDKVARLMRLKEEYGETPDVRAALDRAIGALIEGTLEDESALGVAQVIIAGSDLTQALIKAAVQAGGRDFESAYETIREELDKIDGAGAYQNDHHVVWRYFSNYLERTLYNWRYQHDPREIKLVPDAYFEAYILACTCLIETNRPEKAEACAKRAQSLDPFNPRAAIRLYKAYEMQHKDLACYDLLREFLKFASNPGDIGVAYYRLAYFYWQHGDKRLAAACYAYALRFGSPVHAHAQKELDDLKLADPSLENMSDEEAVRLIAQADLPLAPTKEICERLELAARATVSAGYFAPAKQLLSALAVIHDDVRYEIIAESLGDLS